MKTIEKRKVQPWIFFICYVTSLESTSDSIRGLKNVSPLFADSGYEKIHLLTVLVLDVHSTTWCSFENA